MRIVTDLSMVESLGDEYHKPLYENYSIIGKIRFRGRKHLAVKCSKCSEDPELFHYGVFAITVASINNGEVSCGCSAYPRWNKEQYYIRCKRQADKFGYTFNGFIGYEENVNKKRLIKLDLTCKIHGEWRTTGIVNFLNNSAGCPSCGQDKASNSNKKSEEYWTKLFLATGSFKKGTKFSRINRDLESKTSKYWEVMCPVCSEDEFVKNKLCNGVFKSTTSDLLYGNIPCRCSKYSRITKGQRELLISKEKDYTFIDWVGDFKDSHSCFEYICKAGNVNKTNYNRWDNGVRCPCCSHTGYNPRKQGRFYIVRWFGEGYEFLKFGITNKTVQQRVKEQAAETFLEFEVLYDFLFQDGSIPREIESKALSSMNTKVVEKDVLPYGYTETCHIEDIDELLMLVKQSYS